VQDVDNHESILKVGYTITMSWFSFWVGGAVVGVCSWVILCRSLRWNRANLIKSTFEGRDPYSLTVDEAQWIVQQIGRYEMPFITKYATAFALFRTYGIVTIAEILLKYLVSVTRALMQDDTVRDC
jgi:hypothetical protein